MRSTEGKNAHWQHRTEDVGLDPESQRDICGCGLSIKDRSKGEVIGVPEERYGKAELLMISFQPPKDNAWNSTKDKCVHLRWTQLNFSHLTVHSNFTDFRGDWVQFVNDITSALLRFCFYLFIY